MLLVTKACWPAPRCGRSRSAPCCGVPCIPQHLVPLPVIAGGPASEREDEGLAERFGARGSGAWCPLLAAATERGPPSSLRSPAPQRAVHFQPQLAPPAPPAFACRSAPRPTSALPPRGCCSPATLWVLEGSRPVLPALARPVAFMAVWQQAKPASCGSNHRDCRNLVLLPSLLLALLYCTGQNKRHPHDCMLQVAAGSGQWGQGQPVWALWTCIRAAAVKRSQLGKQNAAGETCNRLSMHNCPCPPGPLHVLQIVSGALNGNQGYVDLVSVAAAAL